MPMIERGQLKDFEVGPAEIGMAESLRRCADWLDEDLNRVLIGMWSMDGAYLQVVVTVMEDAP
jgi:hypothetical protein